VIVFTDAVLRVTVNVAGSHSAALTSLILIPAVSLSFKVAVPTLVHKVALLGLLSVTVKVSPLFSSKVSSVVVTVKVFVVDHAGIVTLPPTTAV